MADGASPGPKARTIAFRDSVILYFHEAGIAGAHRPELDADLNGRHRITHDRGEIHGLGWTVNVARQKTLDLSGSLDRVRDRATQESSDRYAFVAHRRGHPVSDAYVVMPLSVFAGVGVTGLP